MAKTNEKIDAFVKTDDYRFICWLIDHCFNQDIRNSCCEQLGYSIGVDVIDRKEKIYPKSVLIGSHEEFRVASSISNTYRTVECIICKPKES